ncbi:hypothetical protein EON65_27435 [archaeon]|nr:MAG: hypothetical protein EON65_27435 [archaeon]
MTSFHPTSKNKEINLESAFRAIKPFTHTRKHTMQLTIVTIGRSTVVLRHDGGENDYAENSDRCGGERVESYYGCALCFHADMHLVVKITLRANIALDYSVVDMASSILAILLLICIV